MLISGDSREPTLQKRLSHIRARKISADVRIIWQTAWNKEFADQGSRLLLLRLRMPSKASSAVSSYCKKMGFSNMTLYKLTRKKGNM